MKWQLVVLFVGLSAFAAADKRPEKSAEDSARKTRDNVGLGYGVPNGGGWSAQSRDYGPPAPSYGAPSGGYGAPSGGYGAPALSGGYGAPAGKGKLGLGAGWSSSGSGYTHYAKPTLVRIPIKIPIPVPVPKHSHHHHYHKHIRVTPVNHHHKHVKVYPLYQQHRHVKVVPHVTKVIKVQKPILVKPVITPIYKPVVHEYKTTNHKSYDGGAFQGKVSHSHSNGGSYSGGVHKQSYDDGVRHINKGVINVGGGYGQAGPQVQVVPAIVNQGYAAPAPSYAAPLPAPGYGAPAPAPGYGAPDLGSAYGAPGGSAGGYGRSDQGSDDSGAHQQLVDDNGSAGNNAGYGH